MLLILAMILKTHSRASGFIQSMSVKGNYYDNAEHVFFNEYKTRKEASVSIFVFYNRQRLQSYASPVKCSNSYCTQKGCKITISYFHYINLHINNEIYMHLNASLKLLYFSVAHLSYMVL